MTPLQKIAMGLVIITLRVPVAASEVEGPLGPVLVGYDVIAAPLGWVLVIAGVLGLPSPLPRRGLLVGGSLLAGALSVPLWFPQVASATLATAEVAWIVSVPQYAFFALLCHALATAPATVPDEVAPMPPGRRWPSFSLHTVAAAMWFLVLVPPVIIGGGLGALALPAGAAQILAPVALIWILFRLHRFVPAEGRLPESKRTSQVGP